MTENIFIKDTNKRFAWYAKKLVAYRFPALFLLIIIGITGGFFMTKLHFDFDQALFCPAEIAQDYDNFKEEYGNDEFVYILYSNKQGIFNIETLKQTKQLVEEIEEIRYVKKTNSITNIEFMEGNENGDLKINKLMQELPESQEQADLLKQKLLNKPLYLNTYLSEDSGYAAILCELENQSEGDHAYQRKITDQITALLEKSEYENFRFYVTGSPILAASYYDLTEENSILFSTLAGILIIIILILSFHQIKAVIAPFVVVVFTDLLLFGFLGAMDIPLTIMTSMIPSLMLGIGIATTVHVISEYQIHLNRREGNNTSIIESVRLVGFPCLFTSITTGIGFGSLSTSSMAALRDFGLTIGLGTLTVFFSTFTVLIVFLTLFGKRTEKKFKKSYAVKSHRIREFILQKIASLSINYYKQILVFFIIFTGILIYGASKIEVNTSWLDMLGDKVKMAQDVKLIDKTMGSTGSFEIVLDSKKPDGIKTEKFLKTLEKIQEYADSQEYIVNKSFSVVDIIKDVSCSMNNNNKKFYKLPATDDRIAQYLLLYEFSGGKELEKLVGADLSSARLTTYVKAADSKVSMQYYDDLNSYISSILPESYEYKITGHSHMDVSSANLMTETMTRSLSLASIVICLVMIIVFRSFKIGLISMVPNLFPVLFALGFLGLSGIWLSNITATVGCIVIGLAVDDTIHFISRYRMEFERIRNYKKALEATMSGVGHALFITTAILVIGFGVFMVSQMNAFIHAGLLNSICLFMALVADFFLAPALIMVFKPFGKEIETEAV